MKSLFEDAKPIPGQLTWHPTHKAMGRQFFYVEEIEEKGDDLIVTIRHIRPCSTGYLWWKKTEHRFHSSIYRSGGTVWRTSDGIRCPNMEPYLCDVAVKYRWDKEARGPIT